MSGDEQRQGEAQGAQNASNPPNARDAEGASATPSATAADPGGPLRARQIEAQGLADEPPEAPLPTRRGLRPFVRRLVKHRPAFVGLCLVLLFVGAAALGLVFEIQDVRHASPEPFHPPSLEHPFGTDTQGHDMFVLVCRGAVASLLVATLAVLIAVFIGVPLGVVAGYFGGWIDLVLGRIIDVMMTFPSLVLALTIVMLTGQSLKNITIAVGVVGAPLFARQVRASVLVIRSQDYVTAARALGFRRIRILFGAVLPNCLTPILVLATLGIGTAILDVAGLSFLGLSGDPSLPEWGLMLQLNQNDFAQYPWVVLAPGIAIFLTVLGFNLFGDGLRDLLDPQGRRR